MAKSGTLKSGTDGKLCTFFKTHTDLYLYLSSAVKVTHCINNIRDESKQVTVSVVDVERSIIFYEKLGLELIVKSLPHYARFECVEGGSTFSLHKVDKAGEDTRVWIYFEVDDLDNHVNKLMERGIVFEELPNDKSWLWREARLKDPDNNLLILYYAGDNRKNPPWKIKTI